MHTGMILLRKRVLLVSRKKVRLRIAGKKKYPGAVVLNSVWDAPFPM